ncbi:factor associated with metabolism and energy [Rhineura floridana]|uniref:factor associated with metabolism and energy n=1 Tax=Rhineura floridana TaxID=261503 RepID=UPI002AC875F1|nr:factor associated with metabolism and energy [Rhineura floridana]
MGLTSSKARRKVTKVAPMPRQEERLQCPGNMAVYTFQSPLRGASPNSFASRMERNLALERHLPPLREMRQGRYPTVPRTIPLDLRTEGGEASIIKQHPPLRPQKLEPFILAKDIPPEKFLSLQCTAAACEAKGLDQGGQAVLHPAGRRQYLLKMKMLEKRKEAELKRCLHQEARLNKPQLKDLNISETLGCVQGNNSSDDEELLALEFGQTLERNHGDRWDGEFLREHGPSESHLGQVGKVETWLLKQQSRRESSWDASSTDSDDWRPCRKPALVRTKTERIALFDEFFDKEF